MRPNQVLVAILSAAAVTGGVFVGSTSQAQACPLSSKLTSINSIGAGPFNSNSIGTAAGISLLGGLLVVGGIYWSRRQSDSVTDKAEYESELPSVPVDEQVPERELVGSRK